MNTHIEVLDNIVEESVKALENTKGKDIIVIDTSTLSSLFSRMIVVTGDSTRQVKALGKNVESSLKELGFEVVGIEGLENGEWVLVDAGDVIIHSMLKPIREHYDIETLWGMEKSIQRNVI